jgi:hypothetical protein
VRLYVPTIQVRAVEIPRILYFMMPTIGHRARTDIRGISVAEAGRDLTKLITKSMKTDPNLSLANRKELADLLKEYEPLHETAKVLYRAKRQELERSILNEYLKEKKGIQLLSEIAATAEKMDALEDELNALGLELDGGVLSICWGAPDSLKDRIAQKIERLIGTENDIDARFESARLALMIVPTLEDAKKIIDSVSEPTK